MPLPNELVHDFALIMDVHEDPDVGDQMAIFNDFSLFITGVRRNDALAANGNKLNISVSLKIDDIIFIRSQSRITLTASVPRAHFKYKSSVCNCTKDEGRPLGAGLQEQVSNRLKLRW
jgi:hypothetical protein